MVEYNLNNIHKAFLLYFPIPVHFINSNIKISKYNFVFIVLIFPYKFVILWKSLLNYVPFVPTCLTCLCALRAYAPYVPTCLRALNYYLPTCLRAFIFHVLTCLQSLTKYIEAHFYTLHCWFSLEYLQKQLPKVFFKKRCS